MRTPTIHLNGTPRSYLQERYEAAYRALTEALQALQETSPNGRDYYVQGPRAFGEACEEHSQRLAALAAVRDDMLALHDSCSEGAQQLKALGDDQP